MAFDISDTYIFLHFAQFKISYTRNMNERFVFKVRREGSTKYSRCLNIAKHRLNNAPIVKQ